ncbi:hypothetical protein GCM10008985_04290 [Halococcus dombrowskii]|uniref:Uncharacterized protein n=1 Tax=Halococcus dombrowskii TaxID=179637 RepID=A0AAV3SD02_HALDO
MRAFGASGQDIYPFSGKDLSRIQLLDAGVVVIGPRVGLFVRFDCCLPVVHCSEFDLAIEVFAGLGETPRETTSAAE